MAPSSPVQRRLYAWALPLGTPEGPQRPSRRTIYTHIDCPQAAVRAFIEAGVPMGPADQFETDNKNGRKRKVKRFYNPRCVMRVPERDVRG